MKKISFLARSEEAQYNHLRPEPANKNLPEWYKRMPSTIEKKLGHLPSKNRNGDTNFTVKACTPFEDALRCGYFIFLSSDVYVTQKEDHEYRINWTVNYPVVEGHSSTQIPGLSLSKEFEEHPYKWMNDWGISLPSGYSYLVTHPLNRFDLPFFTMSAIIDGDSFTRQVNFPFLLKKDFEGFIEKGTPIAQIIPIKRDNWISDTSEYKKEYSFSHNDLKSISIKSYKKRWWNRKQYK
jgi:hypothetical protein